MESPLGTNLARLVRVWRALIDHRLKPLELTQSHWITLHNISQLPPDQSQLQLAKAIGIEQPSLVRTLDQLEEKGLIARHTCINDRRTKRIKLTKSARPFIKEVSNIIDNTRDEILNNISQEEIQLLNNMITKLEKTFWSFITSLNRLRPQHVHHKNKPQGWFFCDEQTKCN